jgi:hypothetical protein
MIFLHFVLQFTVFGTAEAKQRALLVIEEREISLPYVVQLVELTEVAAVILIDLMVFHQLQPLTGYFGVVPLNHIELLR